MGERYEAFTRHTNVMNWRLFDAEMEERNPLQPSTRVRKNGLMMAVDVTRPHLGTYEATRPPMPYDKFLDERRKAEGRPRENISWAQARCKCGRVVTAKRLGMCKSCAARHRQAATVV